jgi:hypothetical protein
VTLKVSRAEGHEDHQAPRNRDGHPLASPAQLRLSPPARTATFPCV